MSDLCKTALYLATDANHLAVVKLLIQWGANPSIPHSVRPPRRCCSAYKDRHPHLELEPLYAAVKNDNFYMIKYLLLASPRMPYKVLTTLRDIVFKTDYAVQAHLNRRTLVQHAQFFATILNSPRSLQEKCRGIIRLALGQCPFRKVNKLPLPPKLQDFILFQDALKDTPSS